MVVLVLGPFVVVENLDFGIDDLCLIRDCGKGQNRMLSSVEPSLASSSALSFPHSPV